MTVGMKDNIDITDDILMEKAGEKAYLQGLDAFLAGSVIDFKRKGSQIIGEVSDGEIHHVTLRHTPDTFDGFCDCPESENIFFCKHCVALALAYRDALNKAGCEQEILDTKYLHDYLTSFEKGELVKLFSKVIYENSGLRSEWVSRAQCAAGKVDINRLTKRITQVLPYNKHLLNYTQVRHYFNAVEPVVEQLGETIRHLSAEKALSLIDYAISRLARALESIDDSGGCRLHAEETLKSFHKATVSRLEWDKEKVVDYLTALFFSDISDFYPAIPGDYLADMGDDVKTLFFKKIEQRWMSLPTLKEGASWEERIPYYRLQDILANRARVDGDNDSLIRIFRKTACDENDYIRMCELCLELNEVNQAEFWLKKLQRAKTQYRRDMILRVEVKYYQAIEEHDKALECQWQLYTHYLNIDDYTALIDVAKKCEQGSVYQDKAIQYLMTKLAYSDKPSLTPRYTNALVELYMLEGRDEEALPIIERHQISVELLIKTARKNTWRPMVALKLYFRIANFYLANKSNQHYKMAVDILSECSACLKTEAHKEVYYEYLNAMRCENKTKTNFIALLDEHVAEFAE